MASSPNAPAPEPKKKKNFWHKIGDVFYKIGDALGNTLAKSSGLGGDE